MGFPPCPTIQKVYQLDLFPTQYLKQTLKTIHGAHLDFSLDVLNGVAGFNLEGDGLAGQSLHEDLHSTTESQDQVKSALLLDVVV